LTTRRDDGAITDDVRERAWARHREAVARALTRYPVDLVHMHGLDFHRYLPPAGSPVLATLHLPPASYPAAVFDAARTDTWMHCVSASQRRDCPPGVRLLPDAKRGFALMLGRVCPDKGCHLALQAAEMAGVPLLLGGRVYPYPEHERYFRTQVVPRLDARRRFVGALGFARKRRLLSAARCLLVPSLAPETSSLVAMEALACGTPVVAFPMGALPDIVEHCRTGFVVGDVGEMAAAIRDVDTLDPELCRAAARERFSEKAMVDRYLALYARVLEESRTTGVEARAGAA
jgi:glycosyltransferase involved in cell wall biosynthesis